MCRSYKFILCTRSFNSSNIQCLSTWLSFKLFFIACYVLFWIWTHFSIWTLWSIKQWSIYIKWILLGICKLWSSSFFFGSYSNIFWCFAITITTITSRTNTHSKLMLEIRHIIPHCLSVITKWFSFICYNLYHN